MNGIVTRSALIPLPAPRVGISIRQGTMDDVAFIDAMQKKTLNQVGFMPRGQIEGKIRLGHVLVAEEGNRSQKSEVRDQTGAQPGAHLTSDLRPLTSSSRLGYCIGNDQYFKRDDLGIIYALNVVPGSQRKLIGATLIKAMFERSAYGCRLFCCWCAQDIQANYFWESIGFVPIAFRAGSRGKGRVHIFWQKRIREGDTTTPYWFPYETKGGAIREDRLVLPIPPGTSWQDAKPILLPESTEVRDQKSEVREEGDEISGKKSEVGSKKLPRAHLTSDLRPLTSEKKDEQAFGARGLRFTPPKPEKIEKPKAKREPKPKTHRVKVKNDPRYAAAARELRDRWMEEVGSGRLMLEASGKYDVGRMIESSGAVQILPALPAAA